MKKITIFTPTYNRAHLLSRLYQSLLKQSNLCFEWIIVDDGSIDNTRTLVEKWIEECTLFSIRYYYTSNGGKHRAINLGLNEARGFMFFIVDSDDYLLENTVETILIEDSMVNNQELRLAGLGFNKGYNSESLVGRTFKGKYCLATTLERSKYNILGDKAEVFYLDVISKYRFPEFKGETFLTENVIWNQLGQDGYRILWINEIIYVCQYLNDGLSANLIDLYLNNFQGFTYSMRKNTSFNISMIEKVRLIGIYTRFARILKKSYKEIANDIDQNLLLCIFSGALAKGTRFLKDILKV